MRYFDKIVKIAKRSIICEITKEREHHARCVAIAKLAVAIDRGIWHCAWEVAGRQGKCYCVPCQEERGEKNTVRDEHVKDFLKRLDIACGRSDIAIG